MSEDHQTATPRFDQTWNEYTGDHLHRAANINVPEEFEPQEWEEAGYIPPDRRSRNEIYNWSQFYDFWRWLRENGYINEGADE